jgi:hypothetical protein
MTNSQIGLAAAGFGMILLAFGALWGNALAYPPAVGILGTSRSCASCHANNGPWKDEQGTIVDILDAATRHSLRQADGRLLLQVKRGETATVITIIGRAQEDPTPPPTRNAWLYVDPTRLETKALSKFAPGWDVNLPMSCRIVGDAVAEYPGAAVTALPMTVRPGDAARDTELELQIMLTSGGPGKGNPDSWLRANLVTRKLSLEVLDN